MKKDIIAVTSITCIITFVLLINIFFFEENIYLKPLTILVIFLQVVYFLIRKKTQRKTCLTVLSGLFGCLVENISLINNHWFIISVKFVFFISTCVIHNSVNIYNEKRKLFYWEKLIIVNGTIAITICYFIFIPVNERLSNIIDIFYCAITLVNFLTNFIFLVSSRKITVLFSFIGIFMMILSEFYLITGFTDFAVYCIGAILYTWSILDEPINQDYFEIE